MLYPAQLYKEELRQKLITAWYDPKYSYYFSGSAYEVSVPDNNEKRHDFVHLGENHTIDGYFSYQIDWTTKSLYNFGLIGFAENNTLFLRGCIKQIEDMRRSGIRRVEFWAWSDNPVNKFYQRLIDKYSNGRVAGHLRQSGFFDGKYHDTTIYEILF